MPASFAQVVSALVEECTQQLVALLPAAAAAELDSLTFQAGSIASGAPSAAPRPTRTKRSPGTAGRRATAARKKAPRSAPRSSEEASHTLDAIAALLRTTPGIGEEDIQRTLGRTHGEVRGAVALGLWTDVLRSEGEANATTYFAMD